MGHRLRDDAPLRLFHVTARVNWSAWHLDDDQPKYMLAALLREGLSQFGVRMLAGVFMSNHFHIVVQSPSPERYRRLTGRRTSCRHFRPWPARHPKSSAIAQLMRFVKRSMSVRRHADLGLSGRFWESRYDARIIEDPLSLVVRIAYDHRNPVKAGIVAHPAHYRWSSAAEWATGRPGLVPVALDEPLPFGLSRRELRKSIDRHQEARLAPETEQRIEKLLRGRPRRGSTPLGLLLMEAGVETCGSSAALSAP